MALVKTCDRGWKDYLKMLVHLLPPGYAWEWADNSVGKHLLATWADELARVHLFYCEIVRWGISKFVSDITGWSAPEYERLLKNKWGIDAVVSDGLMPTHCQSACLTPLLDETAPFVIIITVDDKSQFTPAVMAYLNEYKQSHTAFHIRDRSAEFKVVLDVQPTDCEDHCESPLYTKPWHIIEVIADWTYTLNDIKKLPAWAGFETLARAYSILRRAYV